MVMRQDDPRGDERETVSYSLPRRIIKAVARYAVEYDANSKSHAAEELIERGLAVALADQPLLTPDAEKVAGAA